MRKPLSFSLSSPACAADAASRNKCERSDDRRTMTRQAQALSLSMMTLLQQLSIPDRPFALSISLSRSRRRRIRRARIYSLFRSLIGFLLFFFAVYSERFSKSIIVCSCVHRWPWTRWDIWFLRKYYHYWIVIAYTILIQIIVYTNRKKIRLTWLKINVNAKKNEKRAPRKAKRKRRQHVIIESQNSNAQEISITRAYNAWMKVYRCVYIYLMINGRLR